MLTYIMQRICGTVCRFRYQTINAKGHFIFDFGGKTLTIQNELDNARAYGGGEETILSNIETMKRKEKL